MLHSSRKGIYYGFYSKHSSCPGKDEKLFKGFDEFCHFCFFYAIFQLEQGKK